MDVPTLAQGLRTLRSVAFYMEPILRAIVAGETDVAALARRVGASEEDCRHALFFLEEMGLVRSTRYVLTELGRKEAK